MDVTPLQRALAAAGKDPGKIDGIWGKDTMAALMAYGAKSAVSDPIKDAAKAMIGPMMQNSINTRLRVMHFLAQVSHESSGFTRLTENLNYRPEVLMTTFKRLGPLENAKRIVAGGPIAIAEAMYGLRADLGNFHTGDGHAYIGRGYIMITGRANYDKFGKLIDLNLVDHPEQAAAPDVAGRLAVAFWADRHLNALADINDIEAVTEGVNGGDKGLDDRKAIFGRYAKVWPG